ncbi:hypothetical protein DFJ74DRAFT_376719 [Hyaloraphidium curvatum]|nr:hypothetical protein DFJ74DRAFT_376719 [Hyaloraphidium curvatum]
MRVRRRGALLIAAAAAFGIAGLPPPAAAFPRGTAAANTSAALEPRWWDATTGWKVGETCCPGCGYNNPENCCCGQNQGRTTVTTLTTATVSSLFTLVTTTTSFTRTVTSTVTLDAVQTLAPTDADSTETETLAPTVTVSPEEPTDETTDGTTDGTTDEGPSLRIGLTNPVALGMAKVAQRLKIPAPRQGNLAGAGAAGQQAGPLKELVTGALEVDRVSRRLLSRNASGPADPRDSPMRLQRRHLCVDCPADVSVSPYRQLFRRTWWFSNGDMRACCQAGTTVFSTRTSFITAVRTTLSTTTVSRTRTVTTTVVVSPLVVGSSRRGSVTDS